MEDEEVAVREEEETEEEGRWWQRRKEDSRRFQISTAFPSPPPRTVSRRLPSWSFVGYAEPVATPPSDVRSRYSLEVNWAVLGQ